MIEKLRELQSNGRIDGLTVHTWPGEVSLETRAYSEVLDTFEAFERWARENGVSIRPPFAIRDRQSAYTEESDTLLLTPSVCLALYDSGDLVGVYPSSRGGSVSSIDDCLDRLSRGGSPGAAERGTGARRGNRQPGTGEGGE